MKNPVKPTEAEQTAPIVHPGMMGDGTEEQNLNEPGDPSLRIRKEDVEAAFEEPTPKLK